MEEGRPLLDWLDRVLAWEIRRRGLGLSMMSLVDSWAGSLLVASLVVSCSIMAEEEDSVEEGVPFIVDGSSIV
jgi:hypothetical protein